ncbi:MAG: T9SS type A sorting domain-containing protein [bacterium]
MKRYVLLILCVIATAAFSLAEMPGWPIETAPATGAVFTSPLVVDLDMDGYLEVITAGPDNFVRAYNLDGTVVSGFPVDLSGNVAVHSAFGNVTSEYDEIVVITLDGDLYVIDSYGDVQPPFPISIAGAPGPAGPVLWDFDGDGFKEIIVHCGNNIHVLDYSGDEYGTFPRAVDSEFGPAGSPAVGDIDGDGEVEIVAVGYQKLYAFEGTGNVLFGFPIELDTSEAFSYSSPVLVDMNGDGFLKISCGYHETMGTSRGKIGLWNNAGEMMSSWPITTAGYGSWIYGSPAAGDIDGDGKPEIVITSLNGRGYVLNEDASAPAPWSLGLGIGNFESSPVIYDFDNDGGPDLLFLGNDVDGSIACFNAPAAEIDSFPFQSDTAWGFATPTVGDFDKDGHVEICAVARSGKIHIYKYVGDGEPYTKPWNMGRHDPLRTGWLYPLPPDTISVESFGDSLRISWSSLINYDSLSYNLYATEDPYDSSGGTLLLNLADTFATVFPDSELSYYFVTASSKYSESQRSMIATVDTTRIEENNIPTDWSLSCYPNPFNAVCMIEAPSNSNLRIYDVSGRLVESFDNVRGAVKWSPREDCPTGVYLVRAEKGGVSYQTRIVLLR